MSRLAVHAHWAVRHLPRGHANGIRIGNTRYARGSLFLEHNYLDRTVMRHSLPRLWGKLHQAEGVTLTAPNRKSIPSTCIGAHCMSITVTLATN